MRLADLVATQIRVVPISAVPGVSFRSAPTVLTGHVAGQGNVAPTSVTQVSIDPILTGDIDCDDVGFRVPAGRHGGIGGDASQRGTRVGHARRQLQE